MHKNSLKYSFLSELRCNFASFLNFSINMICSLHGVTICYWKHIFILVIFGSKTHFCFLKHHLSDRLWLFPSCQTRQRTQFEDWNILATSFSMSFWAGTVLPRLCLFANFGRIYWHHQLLWGTRKSHYIVPKAALFTQIKKNVQLIFISGQKIDLYPKSMLGQPFVLPSSLRSVKSA